MEVESISRPATPLRESKFANPLRYLVTRVNQDHIFIAIFKTPKNRLALVTTLCIIVGNVAYFFLRLHLPLSIPALEEEGTLTRVEWGKIISIAYFVNILGKAFGGALVDLSKQPKWMFVLAVWGCAVAAVLLTVFNSFFAIAVFWCATRFMTSAGRLACIKIILSFWPKDIIGTIMGLINLSCSAGDVLARLFIGKSLDSTTWRTTMCLCALVGTALILPTALLVVNSPEEAFASESPPKGASSIKSEMAPVYGTPLDTVTVVASDGDDSELLELQAGAQGDRHQSSSVFARGLVPKIRHWMVSYWADCLRPLLCQPKFYILLLLSTTLQLLSEIPGQLTHLFLKSELHVSVGEAGSYTSYIRLAGSVSPFIGGYFMDKVRPVKRGLLTAFLVALSSGAFLTLAIFTSWLPELDDWSNELKLAIVMLIASVIEIFLQPPSSYLDGVFLLDLNGIDGAATAAGIVGSVGYILPACLMSKMMGMSTEGIPGWHGVWRVAFIVSLVSVVLCLLYWFFDERTLYLEKQSIAEVEAYKLGAQRRPKPKRSALGVYIWLEKLVMAKFGRG